MNNAQNTTFQQTFKTYN